jgi:hypothetical protein
MTIRASLHAATAVALVVSGGAYAEELTIATVNNSDMIIMQRLSPIWEEATGNTLNWVVLEENVLRQRVTTDIATSGGSFDIITIGAYEAPIWGAQDWLVALDDLGDDYNYERHLRARPRRPLGRRHALRGALLRRKLVHLLPHRPFRGGGDRRADRADHLRPVQGDGGRTARPRERRLRHLPARQGRLGREHGLRRPAGERLRRPLVRHGLAAPDRVRRVAQRHQLLRRPDDELRPARRGVERPQREPRALRRGPLRDLGRCDLGGGLHLQPERKHRGRQHRLLPGAEAGDDRGTGWFWAWALAVPASSTKADAAKDFLAWATSQEYVELVGEREGWVAAPPGTRPRPTRTPPMSRPRPSPRRC